jgi:hemoglobin
VNRPTIFEAAGGSPAFEALTARFYEKVKADPLLSPVFASFTAEHAKHVAIWLGEVFGARPATPRSRAAIGRCSNGTAIWRSRRIRKSDGSGLMLETAEDVLPNDAELQARFADYIRWGAEIALAASQPGLQIEHVGAVPKWEWTSDQ